MQPKQTNKALLGLLVLAAAAVLATSAQDYDDDSYGPQGGGGGGGNQGDPDSYAGPNYGANDESYNGNMPNYPQNVDSDGSNQSPQGAYGAGAGQGGASNDADGDYEGDDSSAASSLSPAVARIKRSAPAPVAEPAKPAAGALKQQPSAAASEPKLRVKRHGKYYIGPVYTYVKTDKHAHFKWGVKHKVGKKHYG